MIRHLLKLVWNRKRANALIVTGDLLLVPGGLRGAGTLAITLVMRWSKPLGFAWQRRLGRERRSSTSTRSAKSDPGAARGDVPAARRSADRSRRSPPWPCSNTPPYSFSTSEGTRQDQRSRRHDEAATTSRMDFADVMQMKVVRGRWFNAEDDASPYLAGGHRRRCRRRRFTATPIRSAQKIEGRRRDRRTGSSAWCETYRKDGESAGAGSAHVPPHHARTRARPPRQPPPGAGAAGHAGRTSRRAGQAAAAVAADDRFQRAAYGPDAR